MCHSGLDGGKFGTVVVAIVDVVAIGVVVAPDVEVAD